MSESTKKPFDGFGSVIEMLKHADSAFRTKIIRNLYKLDPALAERIQAETNKALMRDKQNASQESLNRSMHQQQIKKYSART